MTADPSLAKVQSTAKLCLTGPFGVGKSTLARARIRWLLDEGHTTGDQILVLVPQPINLETYLRDFASSTTAPGPPVEVTTSATLARRAVELYWPVIARQSRAADPNREPTYLNVEAVQYHLGRFVDQAMDRQEFAGISMTRQRIILQLINTLNRAALYGLTLDEAYDRLDALPGGRRGAAHLLALRAARDVSLAFRAHCLESSLVDFSLLMEIFRRQILGDASRSAHMRGPRLHLIADNVEEDNPVTHALVRAWAPDLASLLIVMDEDASYRRMLGADPRGAASLAELCSETIRLDTSHVIPDSISALAAAFDRVLVAAPASKRERAPEASAPAAAAPFSASSEQPAAPANPTPLRVPLDPRGRTFRYYPQMLRWVAREIASLVHDQGVDPGAIVVVAPTIGDSLRFTLQSELDFHGVASTAHRPSRALLDEPATRCVLTLAALAHPAWRRTVVSEDVRFALQTAIGDLDPLRAAIAAADVYRPRGNLGQLGDLGQHDRAARRRVTFRLSEAYDQLHEWLAAYRGAGDPLPVDQFFSLLFEDVLSRRRFGFHGNIDAARATNQLVESARSLRWTFAEEDGLPEDFGAAYADMVSQGVLGALRVPAWEPPANAVLVSPVSAFLVRNRVAEYQFWLDAGSMGWWERIYQPLTHPGILDRNWPAQQIWTDADEFRARQESMRNLVVGLLRRATRGVYVMVTDFSESGYEQRGPLLGAVNRVLAA